MRVVTTFDFRDNLAEYLDLVVRGDVPVVVSKFGKPLVVISPYKKSDVPEWKEFYGFLGSSGESGKELVARVRRSKEEKSRVNRLRTGSV
jgi:prevent-host-death family protein